MWEVRIGGPSTAMALNAEVQVLAGWQLSLTYVLELL